MIKDERQEKIQEYINLKKFVSVNELVDKFHVSKATIRRDLDILFKTGQIALSRGGARCVKDKESELPFNEKRQSNVEEKIAICKEAVQHIKEGNTVLIDTGSTTIQLVPFLREMKGIHVITDDVLIACELAVNPDINITVIGGTIRTGYFTLCKNQSNDLLRSIHADLAFLSLDAVDADFGGSITNQDEVSIKQKMIKASDEVIALCDHTKFGKKVLWNVCKANAINLYITGKDLSKNIYKEFHEKEIPLKLV